MRAPLLTLLLAGCAGIPAGPPVRVAPSSASSRDRVALRSSRAAAASSPSEPGAFAEELHVRCRDFDASCTGSIGMLARDAQPSAQRCTVALIGPDRVLTASHCLEPEERRAGASCAAEWIAFPAAAGQPMEWVGCAGVERADSVDEASVLRNDVAVLRLRRPVARPVIAVDPRPPREGDVVTIVAVTPHPIYDRQHEVAGRHCRVATRSSAVETFGGAASQVGWLMDCPSRPGNSGSPVLDARGHLRALMHGGSHPVHGVGVTSAVPALR